MSREGLWRKKEGSGYGHCWDVRELEVRREWEQEA